MSFQCLRPNLAIQENEGEKPRFLKITTDRDYEYWLKNLPRKYKLFLIPCGTCENCLKRKAQEWTARLLKEIENFKFCYFITLTYDDENIKDLNKRDLQLFLKRYRKFMSKGSKFELKYYINGEYGENTKRPHYHAIFFQNKPINDLKFYSNNLYISFGFAQAWKNGNCLISKQVNERSIKYTVTYTLKKIGETKITLMSKGLGLGYLNDKKEDIKKYKGFYLVDGYKQPFPSYFKRKLKESSDLGDIKYLQDLENEPKASVKLSGSTIGELLNQFLLSNYSEVLKGKGEF